jgi:peptidoglycan/xylan/chitin deacetylase (PgdA/CDA1 family)
VAASINPPGGLAANKVPQFVMFGFDDNAYADGMNWVVNTLFGNKKNADGSPARATFFLIGGASTSQNSGVFTDADGHQTEASWKNAFDKGHEIGNHTWDHAEGGQGWSTATWTTEATKSTNIITSSLGINKCQVAGWRFPYLQFNDSGFSAIQPAGLKYDTSIEFGYDWWQPPGMTSGYGSSSPEYGKHMWWPFTLDHGLDSSFSCCSKGVQAHPGMWEFPAHVFTRPDPQDPTHVRTVTGLDFNVWTTRTNDPSVDFCGTLKYTFDQRYNGNRAPLNAGMHSDIYSAYNSTADGAFSDKHDARRAALKCFLDYVLTKPDARVVSFKTVIEWMRNPQPIH